MICGSAPSTPSTARSDGRTSRSTRRRSASFAAIWRRRSPRSITRNPVWRTLFVKWVATRDIPQRGTREELNRIEEEHRQIGEIERRLEKVRKIGWPVALPIEQVRKEVVPLRRTDEIQKGGSEPLRSSSLGTGSSRCRGPQHRRACDARGDQCPGAAGQALRDRQL